MAIITRTAKGSALTFAEMDANLNGLADGTNLTASQKKKECTAWVVFDGRNGAIYSSYGIGYVTRNSLGFYNIVFSTPMTTLNYALVGSGGGITNSVDLSVRAIQEVTDTPRRLDLVQITTRATNSGGQSLEDWPYVSLVFFGGK